MGGEVLTVPSLARRYEADVPVQHNGCDCGVFALLFAERLARGAPLDFHQRDTPFYRLKIAADIMSLRIL